MAFMQTHCKLYTVCTQTINCVIRCYLFSSHISSDRFTYKSRPSPANAKNGGDGKLAKIVFTLRDLSINSNLYGTMDPCVLTKSRAEHIIQWEILGSGRFIEKMKSVGRTNHKQRQDKRNYTLQMKTKSV